MNDQPLWDWMRERHAIWLRRQAGQPWPWTSDPILQEYRFCNVFRELDTVTEWIRTHWREPYANHPNLWFAMCVARQINWPPTLQAIGFPRYDVHGLGEWFAHAKDTMWDMQRRGEKVYTGAYMLRGDIWRLTAEQETNDKPTYTLDTVLRSVWEARKGKDDPTGILDLFHGLGQVSLQKVHHWFTQFPGWGGFLAYEVVTDLRHTRYLSGAPDIMTWANAGPGAVRGLNRIHGRPLGASLRQEQANAEMRELLYLAPAKLHDANTFVAHPFSPAPVYGVGMELPLEMRDIEHSLCEMDKYLRVQEGSGRPRAKYWRPT